MAISTTHKLFITVNTNINWMKPGEPIILILNIAGIPRMSSVTIFQSDQFFLSIIYYSNLTFRSP